MHLLTCFVEKGQIAAFGSMGTREKACDSAILQHHQEGSSLQSPEIPDPWPPGSQAKCGLKWAVVRRDIRDVTSAPPACQNRTKWAWKCVVLHTGTRRFQLIWAGSLGTSGGSSCKGFPCMWISLAETFAQAEDFKWNWKNICGKCFWNLLVDSYPGNLVPQTRKGKWPSWHVKSKQFEPQQQMLTTNCSQPNSRLNITGRN